MKYISVIGMEVHIELETKSKMFCGCSAKHFRVKPNIHTCPVCLGLPGSLPVPNKKAIELCILIGLSLGCKINKESKFDRKNYFYPDLAKGYQISQYDKPFCENGELKIQKGRSLKGSVLEKDRPSKGYKMIGINRVHMEEDTAKLIHRTINGEKCSLIDFNRSGVPLVEIVTRPDINSSDEAVAYLKKLRQIIRYLGVSDCDMEKGSMRCEANISLKKNSNSKLPNYKVEVKNINSFKFVKKAIEYEIKRQSKILDSAMVPLQETRGYNEDKEITFSQREKENVCNYRYFPEADIPPIKLSNQLVKKLSNQLIELPDQKMKRFINNYGVSEYNTRILTVNRKTADYFDEAIKELKFTLGDLRSSIAQSRFLEKAEELAKTIVNKKVNINKFTPKQLVKHLQKQKTDKVSDKAQLEQIIIKVLEENKKAVEDYKKGKKETIGFLIGQVMKKTKGKADAQVVQKIIVEKIQAS